MISNPILFKFVRRFTVNAPISGKIKAGGGSALGGDNGILLHDDVGFDAVMVTVIAAVVFWRQLHAMPEFMGQNIFHIRRCMGIISAFTVNIIGYILGIDGDQW